MRSVSVSISARWCAGFGIPLAEMVSSYHDINSRENLRAFGIESIQQRVMTGRIFLLDFLQMREMPLVYLAEVVIIPFPVAI
jgi:hypothetical protein